MMDLKIFIYDVLYVLNFHQNLSSIGQLSKKGIICGFTKASILLMMIKKNTNSKGTNDLKSFISVKY